MKKMFLLAMSTALCLSLGACGQAAGGGKDSVSAKTAAREAAVTETTAGKAPVSEASAPDSDQQSTASALSETVPDHGDAEAEGMRKITDLGGNEVEIPAASQIKRVVIISPPVMSFAVQTIPDTNMIVGITHRAFDTSNREILDKVFPDWKSVDTSFLDASFAVNKESLLKLDPDIIFYYGNIQKKGIENIGIPSVDFFSKELKGPEAFSVAWDGLLREIFGKDSSASQKKEWERTDEKVAGLLEKKGTGKVKTGLCVVSDEAGKIVVSGQDSFDAYAQSYFDESGIQNVAGDLQGGQEVSMEKIYEWNPDMIIVFHDAPAKFILDNSIKGQDWSLLDAWKNKAVYDIPRTTFSWITPCADAPLMPLWLLQKAYPELLSESEMRKETVDYYKRNYQIDLTDSNLDSIFGYRDKEGAGL